MPSLFEMYPWIALHSFDGQLLDEGVYIQTVFTTCRQSARKE